MREIQLYFLQLRNKILDWICQKYLKSKSLFDTLKILLSDWILHHIFTKLFLWVLKVLTDTSRAHSWVQNYLYHVFITKNFDKLFKKPKRFVCFCLLNTDCAGKPSPWSHSSKFLRQSALSIFVDFPWLSPHKKMLRMLNTVHSSCSGKNID